MFPLKHLINCTISWKPACKFQRRNNALEAEKRDLFFRAGDSSQWCSRSFLQSSALWKAQWVCLMHGEIFPGCRSCVRGKVVTNATGERLHSQGINKARSSARPRRPRVRPVEEKRGPCIGRLVEDAAFGALVISNSPWLLSWALCLGMEKQVF